jgi:hypothetical protein
MSVERAIFGSMFVYSVLASVGFLWFVGRPSRHEDRAMGWFMAAMGWASVGPNLVWALVAFGLLGAGAGTERAIVYSLGVSLVVQNVFYTWRLSLAARMRGRGRAMGGFLEGLAPYAKAVRGAVIAALGAVLVALSTPGITATEWVLIALAALGVGEQVWSTTNAPLPPSGNLYSSTAAAMRPLE